MADREAIVKKCQECIDSGEPAMDYSFYYRVIELLKHDEQTIESLERTIDKLTKAPAEKPEQKFFVDGDGKMTPLPIQKHGHWKTVSDYYDDEHWQCSACGCEWYLEAGNPDENDMLYCPKCGAKMDEGMK